jgi:hypothetical protein
MPATRTCWRTWSGPTPTSSGRWRATARTPAGEVMTGPVITVTEDTDVEDVRHLLVERRIRRVPVLSGEAGGGGQRLAGIVSRGDVVALLTTEWAWQVCGEAVRGQHPSARCPKCHAGPDRFVLQDACPGD